MKKRRIFISIDLPNKIKDYIQSIQSSIDNNYYRLVDPENLHITLFFLGYLTENEILKVQITVNKSVSNINHFSAYISDVLFLPSTKNPRIISLNIISKERLVKLYDILQDELSGYNFIKLENRKFKPHITIARLKSTITSGINLKNIKKINITPDKWNVSSIDLMESILKPRGTEHKLIRKFKLKHDK